MFKNVRRAIRVLVLIEAVLAERTGPLTRLGALEVPRVAGELRDQRRALRAKRRRAPALDARHAGLVLVNDLGLH